LADGALLDALGRHGDHDGALALFDAPGLDGNLFADLFLMRDRDLAADGALDLAVLGPVFRAEPGHQHLLEAARRRTGGGKGCGRAEDQAQAQHGGSPNENMLTHDRLPLLRNTTTTG